MPSPPAPLTPHAQVKLQSQAAGNTFAKYNGAIDAVKKVRGRFPLVLASGGCLLTPLLDCCTRQSSQKASLACIEAWQRPWRQWRSSTPCCSLHVAKWRCCWRTQMVRLVQRGCNAHSRAEGVGEGLRCWGMLRQCGHTQLCTGCRSA
jgi:hypothetical protein